MTDQTYRDFAKEHEGVPPATLRMFYTIFSQMEKNRQEAEKRHEANIAEWRKLSESAANFRSEWGTYTEDESDMLEKQIADAIRKSGGIGKMKPDLVNADMPVSDKAQFDIVCLNGKEAMLLEVKRTLTKRDVQNFIKKMPVFAEGYPALVKGKKIIGAVVFQTNRSTAAAKMALGAGLQVFRAEGGKNLIQITA